MNVHENSGHEHRAESAISMNPWPAPYIPFRIGLVT